MGNILLLNKDSFETEVANFKGTVAVDFYADWCGPCRMIAPILEELSGELAGKVKIVKVNVDENDVLADRYQIRSIPTMVVFRDGKEVERIIGFNAKEALKAKFEKHI